MICSVKTPSLARSGRPFSVSAAGSFILLAVLLLSGCAGRLEKASALYYQGQPQQALELLDKGDSLGGRNALLFLVEKGVVRHQLGDYRGSIDSLLAAARLIDQFETISLTEQAGSLVINDWMTRYKGEYSERLWIHSYLMMDYLLLGQFDDALVEARLALKRLEQYPDALKNDYFTRALMALCYAQLGEDNDAFLVYKRLAADLGPAPVAADLVRLAARIGMPDEVETYKSYLSEALPQGEAELVLFVANGRIPVKKPGNIILPTLTRISFPYYENRATRLPSLSFIPSDLTPSAVLSTDMAQVAKDALEQRKVQIIVRETARVAGKEALAQSVGNKNGGGTELAVRLGLMLLEEADTRSWLTLPGRLTLVRIPLVAGHYQLEILRGDSSGPLPLPEFDIAPGQRLFRSIRF